MLLIENDMSRRPESSGLARRPGFLMRTVTYEKLQNGQSDCDMWMERKLDNRRSERDYCLKMNPMLM